MTKWVRGFIFYMFVMLVSLSFVSAYCDDTEPEQRGFSVWRTFGVVNDGYFNYTDVCVGDLVLKDYFCQANGTVDWHLVSCSQIFMEGIGACIEGVCVDVMNHTSPIESQSVEKCGLLNNSVLSKLDEIGYSNFSHAEGGMRIGSYKVVDSENGGTLLKLHSVINQSGYLNDSVTFWDPIGDVYYETTLFSDGEGNLTINGIDYHVAFDDRRSLLNPTIFYVYLSLTWGERAYYWNDGLVHDSFYECNPRRIIKSETYVINSTYSITYTNNLSGNSTRTCVTNGSFSEYCDTVETNCYGLTSCQTGNNSTVSDSGGSSSSSGGGGSGGGGGGGSVSSSGSSSGSSGAGSSASDDSSGVESEINVSSGSDESTLEEFTNGEEVEPNILKKILCWIANIADDEGYNVCLAG